MQLYLPSKPRAFLTLPAWQVFALGTVCRHREKPRLPCAVQHLAEDGEAVNKKRTSEP